MSAHEVGGDASDDGFDLPPIPVVDEGCQRTRKRISGRKRMASVSIRLSALESVDRFAVAGIPARAGILGAGDLLAIRVKVHRIICAQ